DPELSICVEESAIARANPAFGGLDLGRQPIILVIPREDPGALDQHLAIVGDLDLDLGRGDADRIGLDLAVRLHASHAARLGRAIELLQVEAEAAVEREDVWADRVARRIAKPHAGKADKALGGTRKGEPPGPNREDNRPPPPASRRGGRARPAAPQP